MTNKFDIKKLMSLMKQTEKLNLNLNKLNESNNRINEIKLDTTTTSSFYKIVNKFFNKILLMDLDKEEEFYLNELKITKEKIKENNEKLKLFFGNTTKSVSNDEIIS